MESINPYAPPAASTTIHHETGVPTERSPRWATWLRWPALLYTGCLTATMMVVGCWQVWFLVRVGNGRPLSISGRQMILLGLFPVSFGIAGLGVRALRALYRQHWKIAARRTLVFFALAIVYSYVFKSL